MPPQKNSGNKGAKRDTNASIKNKRFIQNLLDDLKTEGHVDDIYIGRVIRRLGDGRMEVFYAKKVGNDMRGTVSQAVIRGSFRGRGKHSVWIDVGSFVAIADTGVQGSSALEIVCVMTYDQMRDVAKQIDLDPRIMSSDVTDSSQLVSKMPLNNMTDGFEFEGTAEEEDEDIDIENI